MITPGKRNSGGCILTVEEPGPDVIIEFNVTSVNLYYLMTIIEWNIKAVDGRTWDLKTHSSGNLVTVDERVFQTSGLPANGDCWLYEPTR